MTGSQFQLLKVLAEVVMRSRSISEVERFRIETFHRAVEREEIADYEAAMAAQVPEDEASTL